MPARFKATPVRKRVWNIGRFLVLAAGLTATFGVFFLAGMRVTTKAREVRVPDLKGKSIVDARATLEEIGLSMRIEEPKRADRTIPADHVLSQDPTPGEVVRRQRAIRVRVSDGQREPVLPVVAGLPEGTAEATLSAEHVAVGYKAEVRSTLHNSGSVVAQDPAGGRRAGTVNLLVNRAQSSGGFVVPDLIGSLAVRSTDVLRSAGFRVAVTSEVPYPGLPAGIVVRQVPLPGYRIQTTDTITLEVSR